MHANKRALEDTDALDGSAKKVRKKVASEYTSTHKKVTIEVYDSLISQRYQGNVSNDDLLQAMTKDRDALTGSLYKSITSRSSENY